jgi:APA family basic amino acid/polyamine antiporter
VCAGIIVLRYREPDRPRGFRCPLVPWVPLAGILSCIYLMFGLPWITWVRFVVWLAAGLIIYFSYSYWRSRLRAAPSAPQR